MLAGLSNFAHFPQEALPRRFHELHLKEDRIVVILKQISLALLLVSTALVPDNTQKETQGPLTGVWRGKYFYPQGFGTDPVGFRMVVIQDGDNVVGFIKE